MRRLTYIASDYQLTQEIPGINEPVLKQSFIYYFKNGEFIVNERDKLHNLYIIIDGRAKIITTQKNGKQLILQFLETRDFIGDLTIVKAEENVKDVIAMGECVCLGIPIAVVQEYLITNHDFLLFLSQYIGEKLLFRMEHFKEQQTQELKVRLAKLLLEISINGVYFEKHTEISEYLGVSYRHFMHTFKFFKDEKMIVKDKQGYLIDEEKIKQLILKLS